MTTPSDLRSRRHGSRSDRGTAMVEFAFVGLLLFTLLLGIVGFGMLLSIKNSVTQSANEGARAAVSTFIVTTKEYTSADTQVDILESAKRYAEDTALDRMQERLAHLQGDLDGSPELRCTACSPSTVDNPTITYLARVHDCGITDEAVLEDFTQTVDTADLNDCIYTSVVYHHSDHRVLPMIPLIDGLLPETVTDTADVTLT